MPTELEIAEQIRDGALDSPQKLGTMQLWAIRITGTGAAYRAGLKEYVWRSPDDYLNENFLRRCNGLPVIWIHPEKVQKLNSEEFASRVIGACMLPYIKNDEVWAIARIYDAEAIYEMKAKQYSTSPGVVFAKSDGNETFDLPEGETILIEGVPSLLDHVAVVTSGVWDKAGPATGILTSALIESNTMTDAEKAEAARIDAAKLDAILTGLTAVTGRLDAMDREDKARKDSEEEEAKKREEEDREAKAREDKARRDAARKDRFGARKDGESEEDFKKRFDADELACRKDAMDDGDDETAATDRARKDRKDAETAEEARALKLAEEKREKEEREDKARKDAALNTENTDLKKRMAAFETFMTNSTREVPAAERDALAVAQTRADSVAGMFGDRAPEPLPGETSLAYRKRALDKFKQHSPKFKESRFDSLDTAMLQPIEEIVYNDAQAAARVAPSNTIGGLTRVQEKDSSGRILTRFHGRPMAWMQHFMTDGHSATIIRNPNAGV